MLMNSCIHSLTHSLTHSPTHSLTHTIHHAVRHGWKLEVDQLEARQLLELSATQGFGPAIAKCHMLEVSGLVNDGAKSFNLLKEYWNETHDADVGNPRHRLIHHQITHA